MIEDKHEYYIWFDPNARLLTFSKNSGYLKKAFSEKEELMDYALALTEEGYRIF